MRSKGTIFLLIVIALSIGSGFGFWLTKFQYGLDVNGGMRLTYRMKSEELKADQKQNLPEIRRNLLRILEDRVAQGLGVVEGNVQAKGTDQFVVELPGFTNSDKAREMLKSTASIKCYWAKNVSTDRMTFRKYDKGGSEMVGGGPVENFTIRATGKTIKPEDPEYQEMIKDWELILEGSDLASAKAEVVGTMTQPNFYFSSAGAAKLEAWSRRFMSRGEQIAFVLDGRVLQIAPVKDNTVLSEHAFIDGNFDPAYVNSLVRLLNAGALPVSLEELSSELVDPTIGKAAMSMMVTAGMVAFGLISAFLLVYYGFPGFVALLALLLYILFTLTVMKLIGATFSLAAMAGFILSVGMAVDANILVFERSKEEMRDGRSLQTAVELGFKRALPAILDSNACTILTSLVLSFFGTGAVKGFASTLIIGVLISLFTAVTVTRTLLVFFIESGIANKPELYALKRQWFGESLEERADSKPLQVVNKAWLFFWISIATVVVTLPFLLTGGLKPNVEFQGGIAAQYELADANVTPQALSASLEKAGYKGSNVKIVTVGSMRRAELTVPPTPDLQVDSPDAYSKLAAVSPALKEIPEKPITTVSPTIQKETVQNAIKAVIVSSALIVIYLTARFGFALGGARNGIKFGLSAIGALVHDILVVLGIAALFGKLLGWEVSALFITAMLTVIGFSVHDTIVIFDRIRENLRKPIKGETFENLCNRSITQSFARSINTSMTVIATLLILIFMGTATIDLKFFCVAMLIGILSGTYSSIFNATPILYLWDRSIVKRRGEQHSLVSEAAAEVARLKAAAIAAGTGTMRMDPAAPTQAARGYGQVKRRDSAVDKASREIEED